MGDRSPKYNRVLLKLSGEALGGSRDYGIDLEVVQTIAAQVKRVHEMGVQTAVVVGGGNIFRGLAASDRGFDRATGDYMGMLATVINALALQDALERTGIPARTMTAIQMPQVAEPYIRRRAVRHLEKGRVVILAAGTGNPYFTTDTTAALRAVEIEADVILKATKVDGVYTADPKRDPTAVMLPRIDYLEVLNRGIEVMDNTALTLCMDNGVPIVVFNLLIPGNIERVVLGDPFAEATTLGPLNNAGVAEKMDEHVADALDRGAELVSGGARAEGFPTKLYWQPTILDGVPADSLVAREETFGPVAPVVAIDSLEQAIELANASPYGLLAAIFTRDVEKGLRFADSVRTGWVNVNESSNYWETHLPFGGRAGTASGIGRVGGTAPMDAFTELQTVVLS